MRSARELNRRKRVQAQLAVIGDVWTVEGTLPFGSGGMCVGGVDIVEISKKDGRILRVSHGK